jgi:hypothetical protein
VTDFLKVLKETPLSVGSHDASSGQACVMEKVAILWAMHSGQDVKAVFSDLPECTNAVIASAAQRINDFLGDERQGLNALIPRLLRARRTDSDRRINVRLSIWSARKVLHLVREKDRAVALEAIEAAEAWLENPCAESVQRCRAAAAAYAAYATSHAAAYAAFAAAASAALAALAASAASAASAAPGAPGAHAAAASAAAFDAVAFLDELLDAWEEAVTKEGEDLYVPREWEDDALAFVDDWMASQRDEERTK